MHCSVGRNALIIDYEEKDAFQVRKLVPCKGFLALKSRPNDQYLYPLHNTKFILTISDQKYKSNPPDPLRSDDGPVA